MKNHLRIMLALLKKNNIQPGFVSTVIMLVLLLAISWVDAAVTFPPDGWVLMLIWLLNLATASGAGSFSSDLKNDHIRFLEYLPIQRWHIWLANMGDGLLWLVLFVIAAVWFRTLHWTPPPDQRFQTFATALFDGRHTLLLGAMALAFCAFAVAAYTRLAIERDATAIFRSFLDGIGVVGIVVMLPALLFEVFPSLDDAALPMVAIGLLYCAAGFVAFMYTPREWGRLKRWILIRVPTLLILNAATLLIVVLMSRQWAKLDPNERVAIDLHEDARLGPDILVSLRSRRSGSHLLRLNPDTGAGSIVGRGIQPIGTSSGQMLVRSTFVADHILPRRSKLRVLDESTNEIRPTEFDRESFTDDGHEYSRGRIVWAHDGRHVVFSGWRRGTITTFFIAETSGLILERIPLESGTGFHKGPNDTFLAVPPKPQVEQTGAVRYFIYDLRTSSRADLVLPGVLVTCNPQMTEGICVGIVQDEQGIKQTVYLADLRTMRSQVLIEPAEIPRDRGYPNSAPPASPGFGLSPGFGDSVDSANLRLFPDPAHRQLAWYAMDRDGKATSLNWIDLQTRQRRVLLEESRMQSLVPQPQGDFLASIQVFGFTPAGDALIYHLGNQISRLETTNGYSSVIAETPRTSRYVNWSFSADRQRALAIYQPTRDDDDRSTAPRRLIAEAWTAGRKTVVYDGPPGVHACWYDNDRLLLADGSRLWIIHADGASRRQIYPTE